MKLPLLDADNARRREIAMRYRLEIDNPNVALPKVEAGEDSHVWHLFVVRTARRESLQKHLAEIGIGTQIHYPVPPFRQVAYRELLAGVVLPLTERLSNEVLSLPISPVMDGDQISEVIAAVNAWR